jgi:cell division protein FtsB
MSARRRTPAGGSRRSAASPARRRAGSSPAPARGSRSRTPGGPRRPRVARTAPAAPASPAARSRARRAGLTTRAAVLGLVLCAVVLGLAYPLRTHLSQTAEIDRLTEEQAEREQRVVALQDSIDRWDEPEHIEVEARRRLHYVYPGETAYRLLLPPQPQVGEVAPGVPPVDEGPWWEKIWQSAQKSAAVPGDGDGQEPGPPAAP